MSKYYTVDIEDITSKLPRSVFKVEELEQIAQSIIAAGGLLSPLLLKQTGPESYEVLAGDLEYYAAVRAQEISSNEEEMVNAFIVPDNLVEDAVEQFKIIHKSSATITSGAVNPKDRSIGSGQITNLESRIDEFMRDLKKMRRQDMQSIEQSIGNLQEQLPTKVEPLELFNHANVLELTQKLKIAGIKGKKTTEKIINSIKKEREGDPFTSFKDITDRVNGLGERGMLTLLDSLGGMY